MPTSLLWPEKFFPQTWADFVGQKEIVEYVKGWAGKWEQGEKQEPLLFVGPPGTGKTTLALLCARQMGWELFELNASDFRTQEIIEKLAGAASQTSSLFGKKRLILLDEVDGLQRVDRGGAGAILQILRETKNPVILTANDLYANKQLSSIRNAVEIIKFKKANYLSLAKYLEQACRKEEVQFDTPALQELAKNSAGDIRAALLDLQSLALSKKIQLSSLSSLSYRERTQDIFSTLGEIFKAKTLQDARKARFKAEVDDGLLMRWMEENIPRAMEGEDLANAFQFFSRADIHEGRILRRQYWGLKRYSSELQSAVPLLQTTQRKGWIPFQYPKVMKYLSSSKGARAIRKSLCGKVGKQIHASIRSVQQLELPLLQQLSEDEERAVRIAAQFGLDDKEIAFLVQKDADSKKVKDLLKKAEELKEEMLREKMGIPFPEAPVSSLDESRPVPQKMPGRAKKPAKKSQPAEPKAEKGEKREDKEEHRQTRLF